MTRPFPSLKVLLHLAGAALRLRGLGRPTTVLGAGLPGNAGGTLLAHPTLIQDEVVPWRALRGALISPTWRLHHLGPQRGSERTRCCARRSGRSPQGEYPMATKNKGPTLKLTDVELAKLVG
jgi:hypothetical protein